MEGNLIKKRGSPISYYSRYKRLRITAKQLAYENAALSQEIQETDNKLIIAKTERKCLLRKLLQFEKPESKTTPAVQRKTANGRTSTAKNNPEIDSSTAVSNEDKPKTDEPTVDLKTELVDESQSNH